MALVHFCSLVSLQGLDAVGWRHHCRRRRRRRRRRHCGCCRGDIAIAGNSLRSIQLIRFAPMLLGKRQRRP